MDLNKDYYGILGISNSSSISDIKKRFRKLAMIYHPDKNDGDKHKEEKFKLITEAYNILSNEETKNHYDTFSPYGKKYKSNYNPFINLGYDIFDAFFKNYNFVNFDHGDFKENLDIVVNLYVTLKDVYKGLPVKVTYKRFVHCSNCKGTGFDPKSLSYTCEICEGKGKNNFNEKCEYCQGDGKIYTSPCDVCKGEKIILKDAEFNVVNIENIRNSEDKYLKGFGHQSRYYREIKGDLKLRIIYQDDEKYKIIDNKLHYKLDIHYEDAIYGIEKELKLLDDNIIKINIPEKTKDGDIITIKEKGLIKNIIGERDDLIISINVIIDYSRVAL